MKVCFVHQHSDMNSASCSFYELAILLSPQLTQLISTNSVTSASLKDQKWCPRTFLHRYFLAFAPLNSQLDSDGWKSPLMEVTVPLPMDLQMVLVTGLVCLEEIHLGISGSWDEMIGRGAVTPDHQLTIDRRGISRQFFTMKHISPSVGNFEGPKPHTFSGLAMETSPKKNQAKHLSYWN